MVQLSSEWLSMKELSSIHLFLLLEQHLGSLTSFLCSGQVEAKRDGMWLAELLCKFTV
jgi:hypothetical protein